jgi:hypothetical protein
MARVNVDLNSSGIRRSFRCRRRLCGNARFDSLDFQPDVQPPRDLVTGVQDLAGVGSR